MNDIDSNDISPGDNGLVGREHEKDQVNAVLAALPRGGQVLRVRGVAGTGRSALVHFAAVTARRQGIRVLSAAWAPAERALPYAALHGLLRPELARLSDLPAAERAVLDTAFGGDSTAANAADLATATLRLLATVPEPVLLCVDDLDRLDAASRDVLNALARICGDDTRVGMVMAERAAPGTRRAAPAPCPLTVTLEELPAPQARALLARAGRVTGYTEEQLVLAVARGNPLALTELSLGPGPLGDTAGFGMLPATPRLAEAYTEDLSELSPAARTVLLVAALSASPSAHGILAASTLLLGSPDTARTGLTETMTRGLLTEVSGSNEVELATEVSQVREVEDVREILGVPEATGVAEVSEAPVSAQTPETPGPTGLSDAAQTAGVVAGVVDADGGEGRGLLLFPLPLVRSAVVHLESAARRMAAHAALGQSLASPPHAAWHAARCAAGPDEELARKLEILANGPRSGTGVLVALAALEDAARFSPDPGHRAARLLRAAELACDHGLVEQALRHARRIDPAQLGPYGRALLLWIHDLLPGNGIVGKERITDLCEAARAVAHQDPALTQKLLHAAARRCWWQQAGPDERRMVRRAFEDLRSAPRDARDLVIMALTDPVPVPRPTYPRPTPEMPDGDEAVSPGQIAHLGADCVPVCRPTCPHPASEAPDGEGATLRGQVEHLSADRVPVSRSTCPQPTDPEAPDGEEAVLLGQVAHLIADLDRAAPLFEQAEAAVRAEGRYGRLPQILVSRAMGQIWLGTRWHTARVLAEEGRTIADRTGQPDWAARATATLGLVDALRGRHERALARAAEVEEAALRLGQSRQSGMAALARALTASGTGRYAEAYARLRSLFAEPATPYAYEEFWGLAFLAEAAPHAGETADARAVVAHITSLNRDGRAPLLDRILAYADAVLAPDKEAEDRYRRALEPGAEAWPLLHAMTQFGYGAWLRRRRRVTVSRTPLATAESLFRALGARTRAEQAASELRATGRAAAGPPATDDVSQVLSPQQLTIARLAARGLTNRAIGEQLRLSPRTVASHLYQIFPKLDVTSRAQLAARFGAE
ncbi:LuxR family transcriptional regulator [Streptomyces sp. NPDC005799]|uniref:helix-turn-helix transcriptional regulator n=1 Tax=Streptomyces sp. NPDC005799 TaxID=3154678 RepID=UPI0033DF08DF